MVDNLHAKLVPPGPAYLAPNPVVTQTDERKNGINLPTTTKLLSSAYHRQRVRNTWLYFWNDLDRR